MNLRETEGLEWITALRNHSIRKMVEQKTIHLSLFDQRDLAITRALAGVSSHCVVDLTAGRHMTAAALKQRLGDRSHQFRPWAIARSPWAIVLSDYRLTLPDLQVGAMQARLAPGWRGRLERMRDEPGFEAFVHREICDPPYNRIRGGYRAGSGDWILTGLFAFPQAPLSGNHP